MARTTAFVLKEFFSFFLSTTYILPRGKLREKAPSAGNASCCVGTQFPTTLDKSWFWEQRGQVRFVT